MELEWASAEANRRAALLANAEGGVMQTQDPSVSYPLDPKTSAGEDGLISPQDIKRFIQRYTSTILTCFLIGILAALAYNYSADPLYTARTQIIIDPSLPQVLRDTNSDTTSTIDNAQIESQLEVLRSEKIAIAVIDLLKLQEVPEFGQPTRILHMFTGASPATPEEAQRMALARYQSNLYVRRVGFSYAIEILYTSDSPELAANIANATAEAYIQEQFAARAQAAGRSNAWLEQRIDELRTHMNDAALNAQEFRAKRDYRIAPARAPAQGNPAEQSPNADTAHRSNTIEELDATASTYRRIYESYLGAYTESVQKQSYPVTNARVITAASPLIGQSHPKKKLILVLGGFAGCFLGFAIAFFRQSIDHSVSSARQIREEIGVECLASIPLLAVNPSNSGLTSRLRKSRTANFFKSALDRRPLALASLARMMLSINTRAGLMLQGRLAQRAIQHDDAGDRRPTPTDADTLSAAVSFPFSGFSHGIKTWKTAIALASRSRPIRCLAVTSAVPGEGKSTLSSNLAALYAAAGTRVLLVDGDLRTGRLSQILAPNVAHGLIDAIEETAELEQCIVSANDTGFHFLPTANGAIAHSDVLLGSPKAQAMLKRLQKDYELVIIELPPLVASVDSLAMSSLLDCTVLVAEWGKTPMPVLLEAVHLLRNARAKILGIVLNKVDISTVRYGEAAANYLSHWSPVTTSVRRRA
jgi:capsular exopolysaccharide synthesis family protein